MVEIDPMFNADGDLQHFYFPILKCMFCRCFLVSIFFLILRRFNKSVMCFYRQMGGHGYRTVEVLEWMKIKDQGYGGA